MRVSQIPVTVQDTINGAAFSLPVPAHLLCFTAGHPYPYIVRFPQTGTIAACVSVEFTYKHRLHWNKVFAENYANHHLHEMAKRAVEDMRHHKLTGRKAFRILYGVNRRAYSDRDCD